MNLTESKSVDELKSHIILLERNLFKKSVEVYLEQGYCLSLIKTKLTNFIDWVNDNIPFDIRTAQRRMELYSTAKQRELITTELSHLNNNLIDQLEAIWKEITETKVTSIEKQEKSTERLLDSVRTIKRMHPDKPSYYSKEENLKDEIAKHLREGWVILNGIEKTKEVLNGWNQQFNVWKNTIRKYNNYSLNVQKEKINEMIKGDGNVP